MINGKRIAVVLPAYNAGKDAGGYRPGVAGRGRYQDIG